MQFGINLDHFGNILNTFLNVVVFYWMHSEHLMCTLGTMWMHIGFILHAFGAFGNILGQFGGHTSLNSAHRAPGCPGIKSSRAKRMVVRFQDCSRAARARPGVHHEFVSDVGSMRFYRFRSLRCPCYRTSTSSLRV